MTLDEARTYFHGDHFATENGAEILELGDAYAVCRMELTDHHKNALGNVMGGAIFTLADFAFAVAANQDPEEPVVSTMTSITFLRSARGSTLYARADAVRRGRRNVYYEISVTDELDTLVARLTASGTKLN